MDDSPWLKKVNYRLSLRARVFNLFRYGIDLHDYVRLRRQTDQLRIFKAPRDVQVEEIRLGGVPVYRAVPQGAPDGTVIFVLHGGGFVSGGGTYCRFAGIKIARATGCTAYSVDYSLAPEHPYPAAIDDCAAAYRALLEQGFQPENIVFYGDSAGGSLCLSLCHRLKDEGLPLPAAVVALSPATDLTGCGESRTANLGVDRLFTKGVKGVNAYYAAGRDLQHPWISPLYGDFTGFPPLRIYVGEYEILLSDSVDAGKKAFEQGVDVQVQVWKGMFHVFPVAGNMLPESTRALLEIVAYIREKLNKGER